MRKIFLVLSACLCVLPCPALETYRESVTASYYGADFHGKKTSSGETFDMNAYTCAHKELPFGTVLKVTNLANGVSVRVRVNDRGPFVTDREIDLSTAAARRLDMIKTGTARVRLEIVSRGEDTKLSLATAESAKKIMARKAGAGSAKPAGEKSEKIEKGKKSAAEKPAAPSGKSAGASPHGGAETAAGKNAQGARKAAAKSETAGPDAPPSGGQKAGKTGAGGTTAGGGLWDIQVASFSSRANAESLARALRGRGFQNLVYQTVKGNVRVVVSRVPAAEVEMTLRRLEEAGYGGCLVRERRP